MRLPTDCPYAALIAWASLTLMFATTARTASGPLSDPAPGRWNHGVAKARTVHTVEGRRLVRLVDDANRGEDQPRAYRDPICEAVIEIGLLHGALPPRLTPLDLGVLDFELGAQRQAV